MKQRKQAAGWVDTGGAWVRAMAGVPASLIGAPAVAGGQDWLGWDGWVTVPAVERQRG